MQPFVTSLALASRIISISSSSPAIDVLFVSVYVCMYALLRTSWAPPPPAPTAWFLFCRIDAPFVECSLFRVSWQLLPLANTPLRFTTLVQLTHPLLNHHFLGLPLELSRFCQGRQMIRGIGDTLSSTYYQTYMGKIHSCFFDELVGELPTLSGFFLVSRTAGLRCLLIVARSLDTSKACWFIVRWSWKSKPAK